MNVYMDVVDTLVSRRTGWQLPSRLVPAPQVTTYLYLAIYLCTCHTWVGVATTVDTYILGM